MKPQVNEIYRHFKGNLYKIIAIALDSESLEEMVVYQALYGEQTVYVRSLSMFMSKVDKEKYPDADQVMRFELHEGEIEPEIDPLVMEFLEAETLHEKGNILTALHHKITNEMINTLAISMDIVIEEGDVEARFQELKTCLNTMEKFESGRI